MEIRNSFSNFFVTLSVLYSKIVATLEKMSLEVPKKNYYLIFNFNFALMLQTFRHKIYNLKNKK